MFNNGEFNSKHRVDLQTLHTLYQDIMYSVTVSLHVRIKSLEALNAVGKKLARRTSAFVRPPNRPRDAHNAATVVRWLQRKVGEKDGRMAAKLNFTSRRN